MMQTLMFHIGIFLDEYIETSQNGIDCISEERRTKNTGKSITMYYYFSILFLEVKYYAKNIL
jgi:hypothetical protein